MWANLSLLDACAALDAQQLSATAEGTYGPIYKTLRHLLAAEQGYLNHLTGKPQGSPLGWKEENPDIAGLRECARHSGQGLIDIAAKTTPSDSVHLSWDNLNWPIPAGLMQAQALTHATEHRSQVMTILTQLGIEPPDLSAWNYIQQHVTPTPVE
jgi:uncharacterized damage-inducible protein DinB